MRLVAAAAAALALAAPAAGALPHGGVLVPGRSLGGIRLGVTPAAVARAWGKDFGLCRGCAEPTWYFTYEPFQPQGAGVSFAHGRVDAVFTLWSPADWRTSKSVGVGVPVAVVTSVYGPLPRTDCAGYYALTQTAHDAVTSFYVVNATVWGFGLSRPGAPVCR